MSSSSSSSSSSGKNPFNSVLVPTDFSDASRFAFQWALSAVDHKQSVIIVLHVVDEATVETVTALQLATREEVVAKLRQRAEEQLLDYKRAAVPEIEVDTIVSEGLPFLDIIRKAEDFAVDGIVMGKVGRRGPVEKLLFGSTVEKVLRGARRPVIVLPESGHSTIQE